MLQFSNKSVADVEVKVKFENVLIHTLNPKNLSPKKSKTLHHYLVTSILALNQAPHSYTF